MAAVLLFALASGAAPASLNLFDGLAAGSLVDGDAGWARSEKDNLDGATPEWWVRYHTPAEQPPYLEIYQDVWSNGPNLTVTRELPAAGEVKSWELSGRLKCRHAAENSVFLRVLDEDGAAIASLDRFTLGHKQGKRGPGDSYLTFNGVSLLPKLAGKAKWQAVLDFAQEEWKPFRLRYHADRAEVITLEIGDSTLTAPIPAAARPTAPHGLQLFFGWGLGSQGKGSLLLDSLTFTTEKAGERAGR